MCIENEDALVDFENIQNLDDIYFVGKYLPK